MFRRKANCTRLKAMIDGIGIDVVDIERFEESINRTPGLLEKLFTATERQKPLASLAARFAAKEALYKALSPAHGLTWHDAEVINLENGKPTFLSHTMAGLHLQWWCSSDEYL